ncbi:helix-turn-helix domain-containing protein [Phaeobacter sp. B1627]|uniref:terminase gpP N-terminus-related DNA-binding protein n=1 Tax=Phaeobacter sp. B1627 TaxID=2583809 RepID=UPI002105C097|nr:helix-turn-helix domain-containing protein [Phaeobacter sp. B1627]
MQPYLDVLGPELTVQFLLQFGGSELFIPQNPKRRPRVEKLVGADNVRALANVAHLLQRRVPLANAWISAFLHWQGMPVNEIARTIRRTDRTVRLYLNQYNM